MSVRCVSFSLVLAATSSGFIYEVGPRLAIAQPNSSENERSIVVKLSLEEAVSTALIRSYTLRLSQADDQVAKQQIREAYSELMPRITGNASYSRAFEAPNPFAGSAAASFLTGGDLSSWAVYNERVRQNALATPGQDRVLPEDVSGCAAALGAGGDVVEMNLAQYSECVRQGRRPIDPNINPFLVENTFRGGVALNQLIYSGATFAALKGAKATKDASASRLERVGREIAGQVAALYYGAVLADASVEVLKKSVGRNRDTVAEVRSRFNEGVVPQFQLLSAEVELANVETQLVTANNDAEAAKDTLAFAIGLPVSAPLVLLDTLELSSSTSIALPEMEGLVEKAVSRRHDVQAARHQVRLNRALESLTFSRYLPELRLVANINFVGTVPDNRTTEVAVTETSIFQFEDQERGFFDSSFWGTNITAGVNLTWTLFEGFSRDARLRQDRLETKKARIQLERLEQDIEQQVAREQRNLASALERLSVQNKNVERAELNYNHAQLRIKEGVSSQLELREASDQLDQSQLNRLQAIHDYLVAQVNFQVAIGEPLVLNHKEKAEQ